MGKRTLLLALGATFSIGLVVYQFFFQGSNSDITTQPSSPIETSQVVPVQMQGGIEQPPLDQNLSQPGIVKATDLGAEESLIDGIDTYFCSVAGKQLKESPILPQSGGSLVKLPELKNPSQLMPLKAPPPSQNLSFGMVPMMPQPVVQQYVNLTIGGIFCSKGECRGSTSIGVLSKGDSIGGQTNIAERVEVITMSGIKTDKRFIAY